MAELEQLPKELLCLYSCGAPLSDDSCVVQLNGDYSIDVTIPLLGGLLLFSCFVLDVGLFRIVN